MSDALDGLDRVLVIGLGRSGMPAAQALADAGVEVIAVDERSVEPPDELRRRVEVRTAVTADEIAEIVEEVDLVVPSPGVPEGSPPIQRALATGLPVWSEPELGYRLAPRDLVAITGTNGKTTVTGVITEMLRASDRQAVACGNIGNAFTTAALTAPQDALLIAELSSFQLRFIEELRPQVGVLLNLAADHLDWHGDLASYAAAKARIWSAQRDDDWAVANADDDRVAGLAEASAPGRIAWTSTRTVPDLGVGWEGDRLIANLPGHEGELLRRDELNVTAPHHPANIAAAACAALLVGGEPFGTASAAREHRPGPHRLATVAEADGVRWVDDSKATNPHAAKAALRAVSRGGQDVIWLAGGLSRGDLDELRGGLACVREAILLGTAADELGAILDAEGISARRAASMDEAVAVAAGVARSGDVVLLAPACSSLDQYADYAERGERFASAVQRTVASGEVVHDGQ